MPKLSDRDRLLKIEADQRTLAQEADTVRQTLRSQYGGLLAGIAVERLTEREFKEILNLAIGAGGPAAIASLKALPTQPS